MAVSAATALLQEGLALHRRGALQEAAARYAAVLRAEPGNTEVHYYLGMLACQQGHFSEGAEYARVALAGKPENVGALVLLGRASSALGLHDEALQSFDRAIALDPQLAAAHGHRADLLNDLERHGEAIDAYDRALALAPDRAADWFNRAVALVALGRADEAIASLDRAVACGPDLARAHLLRAKLLAGFRRYDEALKSVDNAVAIEPGLAEAWVDRGNLSVLVGNYKDALTAYDRVLEQSPNLVPAWVGRGNVYLALGETKRAIDAALRALELGETSQAKALIARSLGLATITVDDGRLRSVAQRALAKAWARPLELMNTAIGILKLAPNVKDCIASANRAWPERLPAAELSGPRLSALQADGLLRTILQCGPVTDIGLERLLTSMRYAMLTTGLADELPDQRSLEFFCSVARQCFINEYAFPVTGAEEEASQRLRNVLQQALASGDPCPGIWAVVAGAYFPLHTLTNAEALLDRSWPPCIQALLVQQIAEPAEEKRLASTIPALTGIAGEVSGGVRRQYEENPYPRWTKAVSPELPPPPERQVMQAADVLVAGCGTGLLTIEMAQAQPEARILAIDLSLASLSYAKRMAVKAGLGNIEFAQADIMRLGEIGRQFDFIDTSGVLHHLADPWEGWRVLLSLLRPGGVMQIGLYSAMARRNIVAVRELIAHRGYQAIPADIRRCRQEITATQDGSLLKSVTAWSDFFATSACRDLLFHVQEHRMTLAEIKSFLVANDLKFCGFVLPTPILRRFQARFPEPSAVMNLDCWHAFEFDAPQTFSGMYQFAVQKPDSHGPR